MRVTVRKCPFTGRLFEERDRQEYIFHLNNLREEMRQNREQRRTKAAWKEWLTNEKDSIIDPDMIVPWFLKNQRTIMDYINSSDNYHCSEKFYKADVFEHITVSWKYSARVSNTHCCPEGGVENFQGDPSKPRSYPGWQGYMQGCLIRARAHRSEYPYGAALNAVGIRTGSGGGGNDSWGYDVKIFQADWPGLERSLLFNILKG